MRALECAWDPGLRGGVSGPATDRWVPHISLVFREMWDTAALNQEWFRMQRLKTDLRGIPHLAKNQRDVGHPAIRGRSGK